MYLDINDEIKYSNNKTFHLTIMPFSGEEKNMAVNKIIKKEWRGVCGRVWGEKKERRNDVIIL